ncbi:alpha/beta hydrolase [soil metagenome]
MPVDSPYSQLLAETPVREHSIDVLGARTHYWDYGPEDAATTIVVVHEYRGEHHGLEPVVAHLRGLRIISPDLPAFGLSGPLPGRAHDIDAYSDWLAAFIDALGLRGAAVILGHSFGSIVVSAALARGLGAPKLVLINPIAAPALEGPNRLGSLVTLGFYRVARALPGRIGRALLSARPIVRGMSAFLVQTPDRALRRWIHDQHAAYFSAYANRDTVVQGFEASISNDVSMFAAKIPIPTLLIGADRDPITSVADQRRLAGLFPDASLTVLPGVGHLVHYEKPREAAAAIVAFLGDGRVAGA